MRILIFTPTFALQSQGLIWGLHNFANFMGLDLVSAENLAIMRWIAPSVSNPWGWDENKFSGMSLRFKNLQFLNIGARDEELPLTEDTCLANVLKVETRNEGLDPYLRTRRDWKVEDAFRLLFQFQSDRVIEIESETVELVPVA